MNNANKSLLFNSFPLYIQNVVLSLILLTDSLFLSKVSDEAVAGVGAVLAILYGFVSLINVFSNTATSLLSRSIGEKDKQKTKNIFAFSLIISIGIGAVLMLVQILLSFYAGSWIGLNLEASTASQQYLFYMAPMLITDGLFLNFVSILYAHKKNKITLYASATLAVTNILLNGLLYLNIFQGLYLSTKSIAIATLIAQLPPLLLMGFYITRYLNFSLPTFSLNNTLTHGKETLTLGIPATLEPISSNFSNLVIMSFLATCGTLVVTAYAYCNAILLLITNASYRAVAVSTQVTVAQQQGAKQFDLAHKTLINNLKIYIFVPITALIILNLFSSKILTLFTLDQNVIAYSKTILLWLVFMEPLKAINIIIFPSLRGSADVRTPIVFYIMSQWIYGVFLAWLFGCYLNFGLHGILAGLLLDELSRSIFNFKRWSSKVWIKKLKVSN